MTDTHFALPLLEWLDIPEGTVVLAGFDEPFEVSPFKMARYPITNAQYDTFIEDGGYKNPLWWQDLAQTGGAPRRSDWPEPDCPKLEVCWYEAVAFCRWLSHQLDVAVRLPTEWEWQWAAVGNSGLTYPYGSDFDSTKCNTKESGKGRTNPVTEYVAATTHNGLVDLSGNVWEWCLNEGVTPHNVGVEDSENRVLRGGSWNDPASKAQANFRTHRTPRTRTFNIGFRVIIENATL